MAFYRYGIWFLVIVPTFFAIILLKYAPEVVIGHAVIDASLELSLAGTALSYYGLLFSLYAALAVQDLSHRYFLKIRSPDIIRRLELVAKSINSFANEPASGLRSQMFLSQIPVVLRASKKIKSGDINRIAGEAEKALKYLAGQAEMPRRSDAIAGDVDGFWTLFRKMSELADEAK